MRRVVSLYSSSVGKKVLMAATGIVLVGFIVGHMVGNLKAFLGPESLNAYAEYLRDVGYPLLPHRGFLWAFRIVLLFSVGIHVLAAFQLWMSSRRARTVSYRKEESLSLSYASRTMRWGGVIIVAFVVYHILHFTVGSAHPDFVPGDVYRNLVVGFRQWPVTLVYGVAVGALGFHLYHGVWSLFQTLGANHPRYNRFRRPLAALIAFGMVAGFLSVPAAVLLGVLS